MYINTYICIWRVKLCSIILCYVQDIVCDQVTQITIYKTEMNLINSLFRPHLQAGYTDNNLFSKTASLHNNTDSQRGKTRFNVNDCTLCYGELLCIFLNSLSKSKIKVRFGGHFII